MGDGRSLPLTDTNPFRKEDRWSKRTWLGLRELAFNRLLSLVRFSVDELNM